VGKTPVHLALKPDGGELIVCNFDSDNISIIETTTNEVGNSYLVGTHPARGLVTGDSARLYVSNFGSNSVAVYDIDNGKVITSIAVGSRPDALALSVNESYLLILDSGSGDVAVIERRRPTKLEPAEYALLTMTQVGLQPNNIAVKAFRISKPADAVGR
jgi:YVTN family beta-propeller protein